MYNIRVYAHICDVLPLREEQIINHKKEEEKIGSKYKSTKTKLP